MACYMRLYKFFFHSTILIGIGTALKQALYQLKKIIYKRAACRSDSRIRHLFAEQDTHIALADGQTSDSRIRPTRMMLPNCFYFVRLFFRIGITAKTNPLQRRMKRPEIFVKRLHLDEKCLNPLFRMAVALRRNGELERFLKVKRYLLRSQAV